MDLRRSYGFDEAGARMYGHRARYLNLVPSCCDPLFERAAATLWKGEKNEGDGCRIVIKWKMAEILYLRTEAINNAESVNTAYCK
jgi:hypothetical protein